MAVLEERELLNQKSASVVYEYEGYPSISASYITELVFKYPAKKQQLLHNCCYSRIKLEKKSTNQPSFDHFKFIEIPKIHRFLKRPRWASSWWQTFLHSWWKAFVFFLATQWRVLVTSFSLLTPRIGKPLLPLPFHTWHPPRKHLCFKAPCFFRRLSLYHKLYKQEAWTFTSFDVNQSKKESDKQQAG